MAQVTVEAQGFREASAKALRLLPATKERANRVLARGALEIDRMAKLAAPVDRGRLRSSIRPYFYPEDVVATVGTDVYYAPFQEFGTCQRGAETFTGILPPGYVHGSQHAMPPPGTFRLWAPRHGFPKKGGDFLVRQAIVQNNGIPSHSFLTLAADIEVPRIIRQFEEAIAGVGEDL